MFRNNYKRLFALAAILLLLVLPASAQRPVVSVKPDTSGEHGDFGPNRLFYLHTLVQFGVYTAPYDPGLKTNWWSTALTYGFRSKLRVCSWDALVLDVSYRYDRFSIDQKQMKALPFSPVAHQRERLSVHNVNGAFCNRFNFDRRGNILGIWMDVGVYGDWVFRTSNVYLDQFYDSNSQTAYHYKVKTKIRELAYINNLNYGLTVRAGYDYAGIFASYRMSDLIRDPQGASYGDMPRLLIGIEFYPRED